MPTIASSVVIEKPVDEVFAFVVDMGNEAKWQSSVVEAELTSEGPMGAGSTGREVRMLMGRRVETSYRITEWDANRRYSLESTSGPISVQAAYTFEPTDVGTKLSLSLEPKVGGFLKLMEPMIIDMGQRQIEADFKQLKELLESGG
jgi:uncharacterized membrane protein